MSSAPVVGGFRCSWRLKVVGRVADSDDLPSSNEAEPTVCANGHLLTDSHAFCTVCGSPAQMNTPRMCPNGHEAEADAQYCSECGQPVAAQWTPLPPPPSSQQNHDPSSVGGSRPDAVSDSTGATGGDDMTDTLIQETGRRTALKGWAKLHPIRAILALAAIITFGAAVVPAMAHGNSVTVSSTSSAAPLSAAAQQAKQAGTAEGQTLAQETPFSWPGKQTAEYGNITQYFLSLVSQDGNTRYGKAGLIGAEASACGATLDGQYGGPNYSKSDIFNNDSPRNEYLNSCSNYLEANLVIGYNGQGSPLTFIGTPTTTNSGSTGNSGSYPTSGNGCLQCVTNND